MMATRRSILGKLSDVDQQPEESDTKSAASTTEATANPPTAETEAIKTSAKPPARRRTAAKTTRGKKSADSGRESAPQRGPRRSQTESQIAQAKPQQPSRTRGSGTGRSSSGRSNQRAEREQQMAQLIPFPEGEEAERIKRDPSAAVRVPTTEEAKRFGIYLAADDHRDLAFGKTIDGADANTRLRAMIAYWRTNKQFREAVNRLASGMPRGPRKNQTRP